MSTLHPRFRPIPALLSALLGLGAAGCGTEASLPGGGDTGGAHLVVIASDRNQTPGQFDLYLYDLDQLGFRLIAGINSSSSADRNPSLSSDGLYIAFESDRGGSGGSDIYLYGRAQQALLALAAVNTDSAETEPAFTGDALKLAFTREVAGYKRLRLVDGVGDTLVPLPGLDTTAAYSDWGAAPNATGSVIAFVSDRNGNPDVFVWDRATRTVLPIPVLVSDSIDTEPSLTEDGRYVCFASNRAGSAGGFDIFLYDRTLAALLLVTCNTAENERNPSLSRSGDILTFQSDRATGLGKSDLWNHNRVTDQTGQGTQQSSIADDVDPSLRWR